MKELTNAEEQIMQVVWKLQTALIREVVEALPEPRPAYNTVATFLKLLEKKGFVSYKKYGNTYQYYPLIEQRAYSHASLKKLISSYFGGSFSSMVSSFVSQNDISLKEYEELKQCVLPPKQDDELPT